MIEAGPTLGERAVKYCANICDGKCFADDCVDGDEYFFTLLFERLKVLCVELVEQVDLGLHFRKEVVFCG